MVACEVMAMTAGVPAARIFLLGQFGVEIGGQPVPASAWKKRRAVDVLTTLALSPGRSLHREELIDRFWPEKDLDAGANNLHRALHEVRRITGIELARLERGVARLMEGTWIDVVAFERASSGVEPEALGHAVELYRGALLPDDPYSDALSSRREGLRQRFVDVALALATHREAAHDIDGCISVLRRALEADAALEPAHRQLMEVLARVGRKGDALRQFTECVAAVNARLDAPPTRATLDLRDAIERGDIGPASKPPQSVVVATNAPSSIAVRGEAEPMPTLGDGPSIAVLPFANMSGDAEQEFFADGIAEDILTELSRISGLLVIARNSSFVFKKQAVDVREVGRKLGVRHVLEGSVRKVGRRARITAQLVDATTGGHVWADRFDRDLEDIFAVQDDVTKNIVRQLEVQLTAAERKGLGHRSARVDVEAYDLMMRARANHFKFTPAAASEARSLLGRALELDPSFAAPYAMLAMVHAAEHINGWVSTDGHVAIGMQYARRALELDAEEVQTHQALAILSLWQKDFELAATSAEKAIALGPSYSGAFNVHGQVLDFTGHHAAAIASFEKALRLDPANDLNIHLIGRAQFGDGRHEEAVTSFERRLARSPRSDMSRAYLASIHGAAGRTNEARRLWAEILEINPRFSLERLRRVLPYKEPAWFERFASGILAAGVGTTAA
jgi:TolB-like protein